MKLLFAVSDRDLLNSYSKLLELDGIDVTRAFDGTQVVMRTAAEKFDIAVISDSLPRVELKELLRLLYDEDIPTIVITEKRVTSDTLCRAELACSYLPLPFLPDELRKAIRLLNDKKQTDNTFTAGDARVDIKQFSMNGIRVTNEEIDILKAVTEELPFSVRHESVYISALNRKLERLHKKARIKYIINKGYRLVCDNG